MNIVLLNFLTNKLFYVNVFFRLIRLTRTNMSIRYVKENDGEKRERRRKKGRRRDKEREGEIREREREGEREVKGIER